MISRTARVHPSADIEADVSIGDGTLVWHRAQVRAGSTIGSECIVGRDAFVDSGVVVGNRVKIQNAALIYQGVMVEDGVFIGPGAILTNDRFPRAITATGDVARADDWTVSPITLRRGCSIGAGAVVVAGTTVGEFATVGAGAIVTRDVVAHSLVVGNPARRLGWVCACGARLNDQHGEPANAEPGGRAELGCASCGCAYTYVSDPEGIHERTPEHGPTVTGIAS